MNQRDIPKREFYDFEEIMSNGRLNPRGKRKKSNLGYSKPLQRKIKRVVDKIFDELISSQSMKKRD